MEANNGQDANFNGLGCLGRASKCASRSVALALAELHRQSYGPSPSPSAKDACIEAVRRRESSDRGADDATNAAVNAASAAAPKARRWVPLRHFIVEANGYSKMSRFCVPRWEYEAVVALVAAGHIPHGGPYVAAAEAAVFGHYDNTNSHRWAVLSDSGPRRVQNSIDDDTDQWRKDLVPADIALVELSFLLITLEQWCEQKPNGAWNHASYSLPPHYDCYDLSKSAVKLASGHTPSQMSVKIAASRACKHRNINHHQRGNGTVGIVDRPTVFRAVTCVAEVLHVLHEQACYDLQHLSNASSAMVSGAEGIAASCEKELAEVCRIADEIAGTGRPLSFAVSAFRDLCDAVGLDALEDERPFLALLAPGDWCGAFAGLPLQLVLDAHDGPPPAYTVSRQGENEDQLDVEVNDDNAEFPSLATVSKRSHLWASFEAAARQRQSRVDLRDSLYQGFQGEGLTTSGFAKAVGMRSGLVWVQPGGLSTGPCVAAPSWGPTGDENRWVGKALAKARQAASLLINAAKDKNLPVTVLLPRYDTYAHRHASVSALPGTWAFCRSNGSPDFAFPAYAAAFLKQLTQEEVRVRVLILTDLATDPADNWLIESVDSNAVKFGTTKLQTIYLPEFILAHNLDLLALGNDQRSLSVIYVRQGGENAPFVRASADGRYYKMPPWHESTANELDLRQGGLRLLHRDLPAASLKVSRLVDLPTD